MTESRSSTWLRWTFILPAAVALLAVFLAAWSSWRRDLFLGDLLVYTILWAGIALAWNVTGGLAGRFSLGQAAFYGIGAYASTILYMQAGITPWLGLLAGAVLAAAVAAAIEFSTRRLSNIYYSLATFSFAELLNILARGWREVTNGTTGLTIPYRPSLVNMTFAGKDGYVVVAALYCALCLCVTVAIFRSRFGYFLRAQRDSPAAAECLGVDAGRVRILAGMISAALTAVGGTLFTQYVLFVDPDIAFSFDVSIKAALACIIGGMGTPLGPVWGALVVVPLQRWLIATFGGGYAAVSLALYGFVLIVVVLVLPRGITSFFAGRAAARRSKA